MRRFIERYTSNPIRGLGRIVRGNVRQGLRDMAPAAKIAAAFIPGGALASAGLGAAAGALEQERGASARDIVGGAVRGAGTATALRGAQQQVRGMLTGGGSGGAAGALPVDGVAASPAGLPVDDLITSTTTPTSDPSRLKRLGGFLGRDAVASGIAQGAFGAFEGAQERESREREQDRQYNLSRDRFKLEQEYKKDEDERRRRIAELLAPMLRESMGRFGQSRPQG